MAIQGDKSIGYRITKRLFDIAFSAFCIAIGAVPCLIVAVAVACETGAFPFFTQERLGKGGKPFNIVKLRTMVADSDRLELHLNRSQIEQWHVEHKVDNDPRITRFGAVLRKTSFDEVPNFINVLVGQMSVIGPRPITREELAWFGEDADELLSVPAGVTGWWQVRSRNNAIFETGERQALELEYVRNASILLDTKIFFLTFGAIFKRTGQ